MRRPVAVVDEERVERPRVLRRFKTVAEAETWLGSRPDKAKLERGGYGIDAPEALINGGTEN